jgi:hypothetical protein
MQVLQLLLEKGADGNPCNKWRETPLLIATSNGHVEWFDFWIFADHAIGFGGQPPDLLIKLNYLCVFRWRCPNVGVGSLLTIDY